MQLFNNLKLRIHKSILARSIMKKQIAQAKEVYSMNILRTRSLHTHFYVRKFLGEVILPY